MYSYLRGTLVEQGEWGQQTPMMVIDVQGVGYQVLTSLYTLHALQGKQEQGVTVYTTLIVKEEVLQLVGFATKLERELFEHLQSASGVGVKMALGLMSGLSLSDLTSAIVAGDTRRLTSVKGIGPKLAQKMTLELKEKLTKWCSDQHVGSVLSSGVPQPDDGSDTTAVITKTQAMNEAESVLLSLGYSVSEIVNSLGWLSQQQEAYVDTMSSEEILKRLLKHLATHV